jgi:ABC-type lipoprotein release transport system permease subunit
MNLIKIAWRNLWRSKTRTVLTAFVVFFVVILSIAMSSQQYGMYDNMINNAVEFSGHIQIQDTNYVKNKTINDALYLTDSLLQQVETVKHVAVAVPRIESFSLASFGNKTKGVVVMGIDPDKEKSVSKLDKKIARYKFYRDSVDLDTIQYRKLETLDKTSFVSDKVFKERLESALEKDLYSEELADRLLKVAKINSSYLTNGEKGVLLGEALAEYLQISLGDTLVMISQGYHGASAAGLFIVKGFLKMPLVQLERGIVIMDIGYLQEFFSATDLATNILIKVDKNSQVKTVNKDLNEILQANLIAQTWEELQPEMVQMIESDKAGAIFMKAIFYMIVGFIIFGTIMMMLSERRKEFGILIAVGLKRWKLAVILLIETLLISALGTLLGFFLSYPIINTLHKNPIPLKGQMAQVMEDYGFEPIIFFSNNGDIFYTQALVIFIVSIVIFFFPLMSLRKLNVIKAIRE